MQVRIQQSNTCLHGLHPKKHAGVFFVFAHINWMFMLNETVHKVYLQVKKAELF